MQDRAILQARMLLETLLLNCDEILCFQSFSCNKNNANILCMGGQFFLTKVTVIIIYLWTCSKFNFLVFKKFAISEDNGISQFHSIISVGRWFIGKSDVIGQITLGSTLVAATENAPTESHNQKNKIKSTTKMIFLTGVRLNGHRIHLWGHWATRHRPKAALHHKLCRNLAALAIHRWAFQGFLWKLQKNQ